MALSVRENMEYSQVQSDKEAQSKEIFYMRRKAFFVSVVLAVVLVLAVIALYIAEASIASMAIHSLLVMAIIALNLLFFRFPRFFPDIKLAASLTVFGLYLLSLGLILELRVPSIFTILFLSYAIAAIYQEVRSSILNNIALFFVGMIIIFRFPEFFHTDEGITPNTAYLFVFLLVFVALLAISSFILLKRKRYFFKQLGRIKEREHKVIDTVFRLRENYAGQSFNHGDYYDNMESFTAEFSNHIGVKDVFKERIDILRDMGELDAKKLLEKYTDYSIGDLRELAQLELSKNRKMRYVAFQASQAPHIDISKKDMFSERWYPTLNHHKDSWEVQVVAFAVFYAFMKTEKPLNRSITDEEIMEVLSLEEFTGLIHPSILEVFYNNTNKFVEIIEQSFAKEGGQ